MGDIGQPRRKIILVPEPQPEEAPVTEPAVEPQPEPQHAEVCGMCEREAEIAVSPYCDTCWDREAARSRAVISKTVSEINRREEISRAYRRDMRAPA